ncbi:hypothetical protein RMCBS344292_01170 [Rhizopus microsporus]|nr:hypothetical protein RMCBS344292_01170 [Rhizopus microsporus]
MVVCIIIHKSRLLDDVFDIHQLIHDDRTGFSGLLVCIGWAIVQQQAIGLTILAIMCLFSQRVQMILKVLLSNSSTKTVTRSSQQTYYCFEVYHHQRWWVATGWGHCLLPQDPPAWTDIHLEPSCSIHTFRLPPPTRIGKQQKHVTWVWTDPEWIRGQEGWQYTDWTWKFWSKTRTRRERWYRLAERKEYLVNL